MIDVLQNKRIAKSSLTKPSPNNPYLLLVVSLTQDTDQGAVIG